MLCYVMTKYVMLCYITSFMLCYDMCHVMLCYVMLFDIKYVLCFNIQYVMLWDNMLCYVI